MAFAPGQLYSADWDDDGTFRVVKDDEDFGVGHIPLAPEELERWRPELVGATEVSDDELDGYRIWAEEPDAGVFGPRRGPLARLRDLLLRR